MCVLRPYWLTLALVWAVSPLAAQMGPGGYPPGQYPGGGNVGFPIPHGKTKKSKTDDTNLQSIEGMLRRLDSDQLVLEPDDGRILNFKRTGSTKFLKEGVTIRPGALEPGDDVIVEASQDDEGFFSAVNVIWQKDGTEKDRKHASEEVETSSVKPIAESERPHQRRADAPEKDEDAPKPASRPATPTTASTAQPESQPAPDDNPADLNAPAKTDVPAVKIDSDDEGPPVLKHGGRTMRAAADPPPSVKRQEAGAASEENDDEPVRPAKPVSLSKQRPEDLTLEKARLAAGEFLNTLPDYFCQEFMTRYTSDTHPANWQPRDIVSMALVFEHGKEDYRNIAVNGKMTKKGILDLPGASSEGEFGTVLADVFSPATAAEFDFRKESRSGGRSALVYDFIVDRQHSHWRIMVASQLVQPAYRGAIWIDRETARVLRIEMHATNMPEAFPDDKVETATDFEFVRLSDRQFLLPVHAETLGCQRGTDQCSHNVIDFRNYHKYAGESTIIFK